MNNKMNRNKAYRSMGAGAAAAVLALGILAGCSNGGTVTTSGQSGTAAGMTTTAQSTSPGTQGTAPGTQGTTTQPQSGGLVSGKDARAAVTDRFGGIIQKIEYHYDDTNPLYKGEALKEGTKVVFELSAVTGEFEKWDEENDNGYDDFAAALPQLITMEEAADSVVNRSGKSNTFVQKIDFHWDDSEPMYQGEAFNEDVKYSFKIHARNGDFDEWDVDEDDETWAEQYSNVQ